jgi:hypothetical protein
MVDLHTSLTRELTDVRSAAGLGLPLDGLFSGELQLRELDEIPDPRSSRLHMPHACVSVDSRSGCCLSWSLSWSILCRCCLARSAIIGSIVA